MKLLSCFFMCLASFDALAKSVNISGVDFAYYLPQNADSNTRIMVLFGGRNWDGEKTLGDFDFYGLADSCNLLLISPSFVDRSYWHPEKWSGELLKAAVAHFQKKFQLTPQNFLLYGYSAGGQCANLFYNYMPENVEAWGAHACGVYPDAVVKNGAQAFITCGEQDADRLRISKAFMYKYRENGGRLVWKSFLGGHELNPDALEFAKVFFCDVLKKNTVKFIGEDDSGRIVSVENTTDIDLEFRNYLGSQNIKKLWEER